MMAEDNYETSFDKYRKHGRSCDIVAVSEPASEEWVIETRGPDLSGHIPNAYDAALDRVASAWSIISCRDEYSTKYTEQAETRLGKLYWMTNQMYSVRLRKHGMQVAIDAPYDDALDEQRAHDIEETVLSEELPDCAECDDGTPGRLVDMATDRWLCRDHYSETIDLGTGE